MSEAHAVLAPSDAEVWVHCAGHIGAQAASPTPQKTDDTREGDAAHWLASVAALAMSKQGTLATPAPDIAPNGVLITEEMRMAARSYAASLVAGREYPDQVLVEYKVEMPNIHALCWGTLDGGYIDWKNRVIHLDDFKWGHRAVEARGNWQCLCYLTGLMNVVLRKKDEQDQYWKCVVRITQPRAYHVLGTTRTWELTGGELRGYTNRLNAAATASMSENPSCTSGPWCHYCYAWSCKSRTDAVNSIFEYVNVLDTTAIPAKYLGVVYRIACLAESLASSQKKILAAQMEAMLERGEQVDGYTLEPGRPGALAWNEGLTVEEVQFHASVVGVDCMKPPSLITPTQARSRGMDIEGLAARPRAQKKLTAVEDTTAFYLFST